MSSNKFSFVRPIHVCYEGDDGAGDQGGDQSGSQQTSGQTFTQEQVNAMLAADKRKHAERMKTLEDRLTGTLQTAQLTQQERESLESSLNEVKLQLQTKEQLAAQEKKRLEDQHKTQLTEWQTKAQALEARYTDSTIHRSLLDAAVANKAFNAEQIVALLRPHTKLVDDKPVVDFNDRKVDTGEPVVTQLSPADAVKRMRELSEVHGNLFMDNVVTGVGANSGHGQQGKLNIASLTPEQYAKIRKENPALLGL